MSAEGGEVRSLLARKKKAPGHNPHSSPAVTLDIYSHWTETEKSQAQARQKGKGRGGRGRRPNRLINV
jgi:hypothetical protein